MRAACNHCGLEHTLKDAEFGAHPRVKFRCAKCGKATVVENQRMPDATMVISPLPSFARGSSASSPLNFLSEQEDAGVPLDRKVVLTVLSGPAKGTVHRLVKTRTVLGRERADIALLDAEISRHHCLLEVRDGVVHLRDLDSTNGTFFEGERVRAAMLRDGAEFRVGDSVVRIGFEF